MKTERKVISKLEEITNNITTLAGKIPKDVDPNAVSDDVKIELASYIAQVAAIGWVLDMEEQVAEMVAMLNLGGAMHKAKKALSGG
jgi:hypothetical protein